MFPLCGVESSWCVSVLLSHFSKDGFISSTHNDPTCSTYTTLDKVISYTLKIDGEGVLMRWVIGCVSSCYTIILALYVISFEGAIKDFMSLVVRIVNWF